MQDMLLEASKNPLLNNLLSNLGVPTPVPIQRQENSLDDIIIPNMTVAVSSTSKNGHEEWILPLAQAGANIFTESEVAKAISNKAIAFGRQVQKLSNLSENEKIHGLVFDATGFKNLDDLDKMYQFYHDHLGRLQKNGRAVVIALSFYKENPELALAIEGFVRSLSKEIGAKSSTANLLQMKESPNADIVGPLRFFLSRSSCYVTGQPLALSAKQKAPDSINYKQGLAGKTALVTGAARGIGAEIALALAKEGAHVVCLDRPQESDALAKTARRINGHVFVQDLIEPNAAEKISKYFTSKMKGCDIIVHNAGITCDKTLKKMPEDRWKRVIDINLKAPMEITKRMITEKTLRKEARVVCLSSIAGIAGNFGQTNYSTSKAGLRGFVADMADTMAQNGSTINAVAPGFIETQMTQTIPFFTREVGRRLNSLGQGGQPQDVAQAILFFTLPSSYAVNGQTMRVCGGNLLGA